MVFRNWDEIVIESCVDIESCATSTPVAPTGTAYVKNSLGVDVDIISVPSGGSAEGLAPDADVTNTDASYSGSAPSGGALELPDINILDSGGGVITTSPSVIDVTAPDATITNQAATYSQAILSNASDVLPYQKVLDSDGVTPIVNVDYTAADGYAATCTPTKVLSAYTGQELEDGLSSVQRNSLTSLSLAKPGQTPVTYGANDLGTNNPGATVDFTTLAVNNPNGNTNRFELLGTTVMIDWKHGMYWVIAPQPRLLWQVHNDAALVLTAEGLTGWRLPSVGEIMTITDEYAGDPMLQSLGITRSTTNASFGFALGRVSMFNTTRYGYLILQTSSRGFNLVLDTFSIATNGASALYCKSF